MRVNQKIMNRSLDKKINVLKDIVTKQAQIKASKILEGE
jgi:hypothetical protein